MNFFLIGTLLGSILSSGHDTREACEGRAVLLREKGAIVMCVQAPGQGNVYIGGNTSSSWYCSPNGVCGYSTGRMGQ